MILRPLAFIIENIWRLIQISKDPPITWFAADMVSVNCTINIDKARREFGYVPIMSMDRGMKELKASGD